MVPDPMTGALAAALLCALVATPLVRDLLLRYSVMDVPRERSSHLIPVPRGGGLAVILAVAAGCLAGSWLLGLGTWWPMWGALAILAAVGFVDDLRPLGAFVRLALQALVGIGVGLTLSDGAIRPLIIWAVIGLVVTMVAVNVVNFMDGINTISPLTMSVWGLCMWWAGLDGEGSGLAVIGIVTVGACLGFLPYNAKGLIFLGDVGSYGLGAIVAVTSLYALAHGTSPVIVLAPLVPYLADVFCTLGRRFLRGKPLREGHRDHLYQLVVIRTSLSHAQVGALAALAALMCVLAAIHLSETAAVTTFVAIGGLVGLGPLAMPRDSLLPQGAKMATGVVTRRTES